MIIKSRNLLSETSQKSALSNNAAAAVTSIAVKNTTAMIDSWAIQVGETGEEQTEVLIGTVTNVGTLGCTATDFEHPADTPVYFIKYNQVVFERSTTGTGGTATPMTSGTIEYQPDSWDSKLSQSFTQFDDTSGSVSYAYRTYFRSSALAVNSTESDWITPSGFTFYSLAKLRERIKNKVWNSSFLTDTMIDEWVNECKETMRREAIEVNEDYSLGTANVAFGTAGLGTVTASDFRGNIQRFWVQRSDGTEEATKMDINDFFPDQSFAESDPHFAMQGDSVFIVKPESSGGTAQIVYPTLETPMDSDTDEIPVYLRDHTKVFVDYSLIQAQYKDGKIGLTEKISLENALKSSFKSNISPRNRTGPSKIDIVSPVTSEEFLG